MVTLTCATPPARDAAVRLGPGRSARRVWWFVRAGVTIRRVGPSLARLLLALALALPAGLLGEGARPVLAAAGDLDPTFGSGGKVLTDSPVGVGDALVIQPDGKIVVAGGRFALARYLPNGTLDATFGSGGTVTTDFPGVDAQALAMAIQPGGKLVVAGWHRIPGSVGVDDVLRFALARYTQNGSLDAAFGDGGMVLTDFPGYTGALANAVALQADGRIVVGGAAIFPPPPPNAGNSSHFALARYLPNGTLDATFGSGGRTTTVFGPDPNNDTSWVDGLAIQPDGKLVATGAGGGANFALARYVHDGPGGLGFGIAPEPSRVALGWGGGTGQTGYLLGRFPAATWPLAATATGSIDSTPAPAPNLNCYQLFPLMNSSVLAASDALCALLGVRSQIGPPPGFALRLDESTTARLTWGSSGDQLGYVLLALPQGGAPRTLGLAASARWATDQTSGVPTCYILYAVYAAGLGNTDLACAVPGQASFGATGQAAQRAAATPQATRTVAAPVTEQQLAPQLREGRTQVEQQAGKLRRNGR